MSLDIEIQSLLRSNEVKQIDFSFGYMLISGHGFQRLSDCFSDWQIPHKVRVVVRPAIVGRRPLAHYDRGTIRLKSADVLQTVSGRAVVLHECTHAQCDLRGGNMPQRSAEGAAFIAEAIFRLASGQSLTDIDHEVTAEIREIAESVLGTYRITRHTVELTAEEINIARRVMAQDFWYGNAAYIYNGIGGLIYRGN